MTVRASPGAIQGWVLIATTWLAVAAPAIIAPIAPRMAASFAADPQAVTLVQIGIGFPSLFVALLGGPFGLLADRIGRRRLLLGALLAYAACGVAPIGLDSLPLFLFSRAGVGIAEAAVLATGMALISDYFHGAQREKWLAIQGGSATLVATVLLSLSGALGATGWRIAFLAYTLPVALAIFVAHAIWEPAREDQAGSGGGVETTAPTRLLPGLLGICAVTLLTAIAFFLLLVQLPFLLTERGFGGPGEVAIGTVAASITAPVGALVFRAMAGRGVAARLAASFSASTLGLVIIVLDPGYVPTLIGAAINGVGSGIAFPTLMGWALAGRARAVTGRVAGAWNAAYSLGQFASPPLFLAVAALVGDSAGAMAIFAALLAGGAVAALVVATWHAKLARPDLRYHT